MIQSAAGEVPFMLNGNVWRAAVVPACGTVLGDSFTPTQLLPETPDARVKKSNGKQHVATLDEFTMLLTGIQSALFWSCFAGLMYLALEPFLRKRWPERVISWNRLLAGDWRDPLVGRDILIGAAVGSTGVLLRYLQDLVPKWLGWSPNIPIFPSNPDSAALLGVRGFLPLFINQLSASLVQAFIIVFLLLFMAMLLRRNWLGLGLGWLIIATLFSFITATNKPLISFPFSFLIATMCVATAARFGPLALISLLVFTHLQVFFPITTELASWYAGDFILEAIFLLALAAYGFYTSLAGQPLLRGALLEE